MEEKSIENTLDNSSQRSSFLESTKKELKKVAIGLAVAASLYATYVGVQAYRYFTSPESKMNMALNGREALVMADVVKYTYHKERCKQDGVGIIDRVDICSSAALQYIDLQVQMVSLEKDKRKFSSEHGSELEYKFERIYNPFIFLHEDNWRNFQ